MKLTAIGRYALSTSAVALLAACGGSQPPIGAPGTTPQRPAAAIASARQVLVYVSSPGTGEVFVYNEKNHKLVHKLYGLYQPYGECVDDSGDVFVVTQGSPSSSGSNVYEYAHGGSYPIAI